MPFTPRNQSYFHCTGAIYFKSHVSLWHVREKQFEIEGKLQTFQECLNSKWAGLDKTLDEHTLEFQYKDKKGKDCKVAITLQKLASEDARCKGTFWALKGTRGGKGPHFSDLGDKPELPLKDREQYSIEEILSSRVLGGSYSSDDLDDLMFLEAQDGSLGAVVFPGGLGRNWDGIYGAVGAPGTQSFRTIHLDHLFEALQMLAKEELDAVLNDTPTGGGKTYSMCLWVLMLWLCCCRAVIAVPNEELKTQLKKNFLEMHPCALLGVKVYTHDELFDVNGQPWQDLLNSQDKCIVMIDESHECLKTDFRKAQVRHIQAQPNRMLYFSTATPGIFEAEEANLVLSLSAREKVALGLAQPMAVLNVTSKTVANGAAAQELGLLDRTYMGLADGLMPSRRSAVYAAEDTRLTAVEVLPEGNPHRIDPSKCKSQDELMKMLRANLQPACHGSCLLLPALGDNQALLDVARQLEVTASDQSSFDPQARDVYVKHASSAHSSLGLRDLHETCEGKDAIASSEAQLQHIADYVAQHCPREARVHDLGSLLYIPRSSKESQNINVFRGLVNNTINFLVGEPGLMRLDQWRLENLPELTAKVREGMRAYFTADGNMQGGIMRNVRPYAKRCGIADDVHGDAVARALVATVHIMQRVSSDATRFEALVDAWLSSPEFYQVLADINAAGDNSPEATIRDYIEKYRVLMVRVKADGSREVIQGFRERRVPLWRNGVLNADVAQQDLSIAEIADDNAEQRVYAPVTLEMSVATADAIFGIGCSALYVNPDKDTGYNNLNMQRVVILIDEPDGKTNNPYKIAQGVGRNRGAISLEKPIAMVSTASGVQPSLDANRLSVAEVHKATGRHKKTTDRLRGEKLAASIVEWVKQELDKTGQVDDDALEQFVFAKLFDIFTELYDENNHDQKEALKHFRQVSGHLERALRSAEHRGGVQSSLMARVLLAVMGLVAKVHLFFAGMGVRRDLQKALPLLQEGRHREKLVYCSVCLAGYERKKLLECELGLRYKLHSVQRKIEKDEALRADRATYEALGTDADAAEIQAVEMSIRRGTAELMHTVLADRGFIDMATYCAKRLNPGDMAFIFDAMSGTRGGPTEGSLRRAELVKRIVDAMESGMCVEELMGYIENVADIKECALYMALHDICALNEEILNIVCDYTHTDRDGGVATAPNSKLVQLMTHGVPQGAAAPGTAGILEWEGDYANIPHVGGSASLKRAQHVRGRVQAINKVAELEREEYAPASAVVRRVAKDIVKPASSATRSKPSAKECSKPVKFGSTLNSDMLGYTEDQIRGTGGGAVAGELPKTAMELLSRREDFAQLIGRNVTVKRA